MTDIQNYHTKRKAYHGFRYATWVSGSNQVTICCRSSYNDDLLFFTVPLATFLRIKKWDKNRTKTLRQCAPELTDEQREMLLTGMNEEHHRKAVESRKSI